MTDQPESESASAKLLAELDAVAAFPLQGGRVATRAAAALRALEAEAKIAFESNVNIRLAWRQVRDERDLLAGEVERLQGMLTADAEQGTTKRFLRDRTEGLEAEVARLTSELAAARENEARYLWLRDQGHVGPYPMPYARIAFGYTAEELDAIVDAARRAGEGEA